MKADQLKKLRAYYRSLSEQKQFLDKLKGGNIIPFVAVKPLYSELNSLKNDFPELVPFDINLSRSNDTQINFIAAMSRLAIVIGRLEVEIEEQSDTPIIEKRFFTFVSNPSLKAIIERDYKEIQRAFISRCWKSVIILSGGAIEAILTDLLLANNINAIAAKSAPKENDITRWDLSKLIDVAVELKLVSAGIQKLSHPLREYRNLVHPGNEIRSQLRFDAEEARIAFEVLHILYRDLAGQRT